MNNTPLSSISTPAMFGFANTCPDAPRGDTGSAIAIPGWGDGVWGTQLAFVYNSGSPAYRTYYGHGATVGEWIYFATATPPAVYDLPLAAGFTPIHDRVACTYSKDQFGRVHVTGWIVGNHGSNVTVATLPEGFRPAKEVGGPCYYSADNEQTPTIGRMSINSDGSMFGHSANMAGMKLALFNFSFQAA